MKQHIIPSIVASLIASIAAVGFVHSTRAPEVTHVVSAPAAPVSAAKAAHLAKTVWSEMEQHAIDALTAAVKAKPGQVTIFCVEESKCGDLALNLDNAFESAHWKSEVVNYPLIPPGVGASSPELVAALTDSGLDARLDASTAVLAGDYIVIGARIQPPR
jgi:hypothetical protein